MYSKYTKDNHAIDYFFEIPFSNKNKCYLWVFPVKPKFHDTIVNSHELISIELHLCTVHFL